MYIYKYGVYIYIYTYTSHQFSIMTAPRWTYFTLVLIIPLQLEGTAGGSSHFWKRGGWNVKKQPGSNFSTNWEVESQNFLQDLVHLLEGDDEHPSSENEKTPATRPLWQQPRVLARWLWLPTWLKPVWLEVGDSNKKGQHFILSLSFFFCTRISEFGT